MQAPIRPKIPPMTDAQLKETLVRLSQQPTEREFFNVWVATPVQKSRRKLEGNFYSDYLGCYSYWRTRGNKSRQRLKRVSTRIRKLAVKFANDRKARGRAFNIMAAQGGQFSEFFFPTVTISVDPNAPPVPPRPTPWYSSASYIRRQKKKGKR